MCNIHNKYFIYKDCWQEFCHIFFFKKKNIEKCNSYEPSWYAHHSCFFERMIGNSRDTWMVFPQYECECDSSYWWVLSLFLNRLGTHIHNGQVWWVQHSETNGRISEYWIIFLTHRWKFSFHRCLIHHH